MILIAELISHFVNGNVNMAKIMKKAQTGKNVPKGMVESEMSPGKMIPKSKSNYANGNYAKMLQAGKPKPKVAPKKAQTGRSMGSYATQDRKTGNYDALGRFKNEKGEDRYYRSSGPILYDLEKQNQRKSLMNSSDSVRSNTLTAREREVMKSQEGMKKGGKMTKSKMAKGGMLKRADGSYSKRGLWDNIRANKGSGKKPTAAMLKQEKKIKSKTKK